MVKLAVAVPLLDVTVLACAVPPNNRSADVIAKTAMAFRCEKIMLLSSKKRICVALCWSYMSTTNTRLNCYGQCFFLYYFFLK
jgi:hypothetical protein